VDSDLRGHDMSVAVFLHKRVKSDNKPPLREVDSDSRGHVTSVAVFLLKKAETGRPMHKFTNFCALIFSRKI
jgi:hypothetical protein